MLPGTARTSAAAPLLAAVATAGALLLAAAVGARSGPADGFTVLAVLSALAGGAALAVWVSPAVTISAGLVLSVSSGHFGDMGSPIGVDRLVIVAGIAAAILRDVRSPQPRLRVRGIHLLLAAIATYVAVSAFLVGTLRQSTPFFALLDYLGFVPFLLFFVAPAAFGTSRERRLLLGVLTGLGLYLGATALAETLDWRWAVFPRYINNPGVG